MKQQHRNLSGGEQAQQQGHNQQQTPHEFDNAEEMLRFDAKQTPVPPEIKERLKQSEAEEPVPKKSWWRRFFSK